MATQINTAFAPTRTSPRDRSDREPRFTLAMFGEVTEDNDRVARLEVRPGMVEGDYLGLSLQCWGMGAGYIANGEPHYFTGRTLATIAAGLWISEGRR